MRDTILLKLAGAEGGLTVGEILGQPPPLDDRNADLVRHKLHRLKRQGLVRKLGFIEGARGRPSVWCATRLGLEYVGDFVSLS